MLALCLATSAVPAMGQAQASTGQIAGSVTDSQGAAIANATVKVSNTQTGLQRTTESTDDGLYRVVLLPPGVYNVSAESNGFTPVTVNSVQVVVGRTTDVNITLGASGVTEVVNVTAGAIQVQTTRSEADAVINERAIENLPINGRRFQDFVTLTPGAQVDPRRQQISLSGQLGIHTNVNIDGADYNQPFFGGVRGGERSNNAYTVPQESIKEFQVVASGYSAEFGRSTGGIVNAVTKSGTNDFHGSAFILGRPEKLSLDNNFIDAIEVSLSNQASVSGQRELRDIKAAPTQIQWGGSIGGPIKRDKAFFFASYEQQRLRQDREVFFSALSGFVPTADQVEAFNFYRSLEGPYEQTNDAIALLGRFDYEINNNHRFNVRYNFSDNDAENAASNGVPLFPTNNSALSNNGTEQDRTHTVVGQLASFFTSTLVNELRAQYSHERRPRLSNSAEPAVEAGGTTGLGRFGTVSFLPTTQYDWRVQIADAITYTRGSHTFKLGGEYNHVFVDQEFGFNQFGRFTLSSNASSALETLSLGGPTPNRFDNSSARYFRQIGNLQANFATNELAFFGQDSWRIRPNLTINYGLRWEAQYNPDPELGNNDLINLIKDFRFPSGHELDPTQLFDDANNFGPRFGFAWDPFNDTKTVIRGFGGVYYSRTPALLLAAPFNNFRDPAGDLSIQLGPGLTPGPGSSVSGANTVYKQLRLIGIDLNTFPIDNLPIISPEQIRQIAVLFGRNPNTFGIAPILMAEDYQNPKSTQAGIGVEREINRGFTVGADFTWIKTVYLQQNRDVNLPEPIVRPAATDPTLRNFFGSAAGPRPIPELGQIQVRESTGKSLYRALTLRTKFQRGWGQFSAFYVLSKSLSTTDNEREAGGVQYVDSRNLEPEYGLSNLDRRHQFTVNPIFFLPHGIDFSSAIRIRSGRPIDATLAQFDPNGDGNGNDRPYLAPGVAFERNMFRNLATYDLDFRVQKRFALGETRRLILSLEMFNAFNLDNIQLAGFDVTNFCASSTQLNCGFLRPTNPNFLATIESRPGNPRLGSLLLNNNSGDPFQVQLGARFTF
jgi:outer membrane receptor for ferrienterochelin and colicin